MNYEILLDLFTELIPLATALYIIGAFLKITPNIADWLISWILLTVSVIASSLLYGFDIQAIVSGVLSSGLAVFGNKLYSHAQSGINNKDKKEK